ncbi:acyl-CoA-binding domain-containing protein 6-like [Sinocyclocheilus grahami]|uniref:acyl-CoA-binding domain-containing protein 6-like n=1 Tax=Sinocyclocheilus grahami TaxID=75366 RepID=UPI0007ACA389|nr:PREDICTED: acyl-CoA-binding domain-containing protein 6-like [Sinocyclocheilus grahami]
MCKEISPSSSPDSATGSGTDPARPDTGEPLGGGSDSDSDFGLGKFDCGAGDTALRLEGADLENEFEAAADRVRDLVQTASREQLLYLYARFKQSSERRGGEKRTGFGGPAVSSLYQEEKIREEDKNIFDYCRENNIEYVSEAISSKKMEVNTRDEEGRALLHWACDRGHKDLVSLLLQNNADINSQDDEGQTALHYASACEFAEIVELLLKAGADPSIKDQEGSLPEEVTESSAISSLLRQYTAPKG